MVAKGEKIAALILYAEIILDRYILLLKRPFLQYHNNIINIYLPVTSQTGYGSTK